MNFFLLFISRFTYTPFQYICFLFTNLIDYVDLDYTHDVTYLLIVVGVSVK